MHLFNNICKNIINVFVFFQNPIIFFLPGNKTWHVLMAWTNQFEQIISWHPPITASSMFSWDVMLEGHGRSGVFPGSEPHWSMYKTQSLYLYSLIGPCRWSARLLLETCYILICYSFGFIAETGYYLWEKHINWHWRRRRKVSINSGRFFWGQSLPMAPFDSSASLPREERTWDPGWEAC